MIFSWLAVKIRKVFWEVKIVAQTNKKLIAKAQEIKAILEDGAEFFSVSRLVNDKKPSMLFSNVNGGLKPWADILPKPENNAIDAAYLNKLLDALEVEKQKSGASNKSDKPGLLPKIPELNF